jgi:recombination protein RecT
MSNQLTWGQAIEQVAPKFNEIAKTQNLVAWAEESQFAFQAIQKNEKLSQCSVLTVQNAVINVAAVGLTLNPALGYAYLVPESEKVKDQNNRDVWVQYCQLRVSFKGLLKIATDSGSILWAKAEIVKAKDLFKYRGPCALPEHEMDAFGDRGDTIGVYCVAKTHQGDLLVDVMSSKEIAQIRAAAKQDGVWSKWHDEMAKKAILKRASKQWPKTDRDDRLDRAIAVVNEYEGSDDIKTEKDITPKPEQLQPAKRPISNDGLNQAMLKISNGELSIETLKARIEFNEEQQAAIDKWVAGAEWINLEAAQ